MTDLVFVYGTLLRGMERGHIMASGKFLGPGLVKADLFDLAFYPAIQPGNREVAGELYEVDQYTLAQLDCIESFEPAYPHSSLFVRKTIKVTLLSDGSMVEAFAYFQEDADKKGTVIECGDYRRYRTEKSGNKAWVIAYGSNIGRERFSRRVCELSDCGKLYLTGRRAGSKLKNEITRAS